MRDAHRMKEKYDVSLDNRQIVSLFIGAIVVMGAVFVLGVVVGKNLAGTQAGAAAPDLLSALDAQAEAMRNPPVVIDPPLTFQDELTEKKTLTPPPAAPTKLVEVAPVDEKEPAAPEPLKAEPKKPEVKIAEKATEKPAPVKEEAGEKPALVAVEGQVEKTQVPTRTNDVGLKDAIARVSQKPQETSANGDWTLQLSASQNRDEAEKFAARLRDRGYAPYIVKAEVGEKGTWFRVRMGRFASKDAAQRYLQDFRRETQLDAFVAVAQ